MRKFVPLMIFGLLAAFSPRSVSAQMWFEGDYLFWGRANTSSQQYVTGGAASDDVKFNFASGYRLSLGGGMGNYELEAILSQIDGWNANDTSVLALPVAFDGTNGNAIVFPGGANTLAFTSGLALAAMQPAEANEAEFLIAGALARHAYSSNLRDLQVNFGSHRDLSWFRWGIGYRGLLLNENGGFGLTRAFNALDLDDGAGPASAAGNDPNDGLVDASFTAAGFTTLNGGGFRAIDPTVPRVDRLSMLVNGITENRLDGAQLTLAARTAPYQMLTVEAFARLGLFCNRINGSVNELLVGGGDSDSMYVRTLNAKTAHASVGFNPGIRTLFNVTDYIAVTAGYEMLLLTGVGLGPDQLGQVQTNIVGAPAYKVDSSGLFLGHGGNVGIEVRW